MEEYRYKEFIYLIIPMMLGIEFFVTAKHEKKGSAETPIGSYVLDGCGFVFAALLPSIFIFTIWAIESKRFLLNADTLARIDRYAVLFFFMGAWWQIYMISALRARRLRDNPGGGWSIWLPYLGLGIFISLLVLWSAPWGLSWVSVAWFLATFGFMKLVKAAPKTIERFFWVLSVLAFLGENLMFMFFEAVV